jgi:tetratricopeptide (TPR) repeat protein
VFGPQLAGQLPAALADCNELLKLQPADAAALNMRGFAYMKAGHAGKAITDFDAALRSDPNNAGALYGRGLAKLKKHDKTGHPDIAAAKALKPEIEQDLARYDIR